MQIRKFLALLTCAATAIAAAPLARSDGVCNAGYRDTTPTERATMTSILEAAKKALPPAPAGWAIVGDDQVSVPKTLCRDYERNPWNYEFTRYYQRVDDQAARDKIIADSAARAAAAFKLKQPRLDAAMARMNKLSQAYAAFAQKGDTEHAAATYTQMTKAQEDYQKIVDEGDSAKDLAAATDQAGRDRQVQVTVQINASGQTPGTGARNLPLPPGARAAVHWLENGRDPHADRALILVGQWTPGTDGHWQPLRRAGAAVHAAHVASISVVADSERLAATVASINVKSLASQLLN